jgi:hypothetical protein
VLDVHPRGGVVVGDHGEPARHRLQGHVAEGLGLAGEEEDVGRGVVRGQVVRRPESTKHEIGMVALEGGAQRPVSHHDEAEVAVHRPHGPVRVDREPDILLRRKPPDVQDHQIVVRRAPGATERRRSAGRVEAAAVDAASEHTEIPEAGGRELVAQS